MTEDAELTPAGKVRVRLTELCGCPVLNTRGPSDLAALAPRTPDGGIEVTIGNLAARPRTITIAGPEDVRAELSLDAWSTATVVL